MQDDAVANVNADSEDGSKEQYGSGLEKSLKREESGRREKEKDKERPDACGSLSLD